MKNVCRKPKIDRNKMKDGMDEKLLENCKYACFAFIYTWFPQIAKLVDIN